MIGRTTPRPRCITLSIAACLAVLAMAPLSAARAQLSEDLDRRLSTMNDSSEGWATIRGPMEGKYPFPDPDPRAPEAPRYKAPDIEPVNAELLELVAESAERQWTGVAVAPDGRVFVCYPRWFTRYEHAVEVLNSDGAGEPYPSLEWQVVLPEDSFRERFLCVQALYVDDENRLWVLDTGAPKFGPIFRPGGAKLVAFNLTTNELVEQIEFDPDSAPDGTYLNDVRVDTTRDMAYITDSGSGAIVVVDLLNRTSWRTLDRHPSTAGVGGFQPVIEGRPLKMAHNGETPVIQADGIALSADGETLFFQAITSPFRYSVPTAVLANRVAAPADRANSVALAQPAPVSDGILMTSDGTLLFTALEHSGIIARLPDGEHRLLVRDARLAWPDSLALGPNGYLYVTTAQIHRGHPFARKGEFEAEPYRVFRFDLAAALEASERVTVRPAGVE
ncbi:MAG: L-dopachrome tautomerase-related protein [Planctomycetota bacterium]